MSLQEKILTIFYVIVSLLSVVGVVELIARILGYQ